MSDATSGGTRASVVSSKKERSEVAESVVSAKPRASISGKPRASISHPPEPSKRDSQIAKAFIPPAPTPSAAPTPAKKTGKDGRSCCKLSKMLAFVARIVLLATNVALMLFAVVALYFGMLFMPMEKPEGDEDLKKFGIKDGNLDEDNNPFHSFYTTLGLAIIILSIICMGLGYVGYCGALCASRRILKAYTFLLNIFFVVYLVLTIHQYWQKNVGKSDMIESLHKYRGINDMASNSRIWSILMVHYRCCGVDGYEDFQSFKGWRNKTVKLTSEQITPLVCCKSRSDIQLRSYLCTTKNGANTNNNNMDTGCYQQMFDRFFYSKTIMIVVVCSHLTLFVQMIFAWWIISDIDNENLKDFDAKQWSKAQMDKRRKP